MCIVMLIKLLNDVAYMYDVCYLRGADTFNEKP